MRGRFATDHSGRTFGWLTVIRKLDKKSLDGRVLFETRCKCGTISIKVGADMVRGNSRSCGCLRRDATRQRAMRDGSYPRKPNGQFMSPLP